MGNGTLGNDTQPHSSKTAILGGAILGQCCKALLLAIAMLRTAAQSLNREPNL